MTPEHSRLSARPSSAMWSAAAVIVACSACAVEARAADRPRVPGEDIERLRASQVIFQTVVDTMRPYLVRIDTVGGAQPREVLLPTDEDEGAPGGRRRASQNPFRDSPGSDFVIADGSTTGLIHSPDGYIITSSFNFVRDPVLISVTLPDGRRLAADLIARDHVRKIALLKVEAMDLPTPTWKSRDEVRVGDWAIALGLGFGGAEPSVTVGIISALNRMAGNAIQTDAKLSPANYGGPLCDVRGRVVGICVPMAQRPGELAGVELYDAGVGFVVFKERVEEIVARLKRGESFYRGWLGMVSDPSAPHAVIVRNVADPSPMRSAGVVPGDRIVRAAGQEVRHFGQLVQTLNMLAAGDSVELDVEREGTVFSVSVTLARSADLGALPELSEPFDPSAPLPPPDEEEGDE